jgi:hypothetical protein
MPGKNGEREIEKKRLKASQINREIDRQRERNRKRERRGRGKYIEKKMTYKKCLK